MPTPSSRIVIVSPGAGSARGGNRVTALRWARHLRGLALRVAFAPEWDGEPCDLLVALHARKSAPSVERFKREHSGRPVVVAGTGTDLYEDLERPDRAQEVLATLGRADAIVVLQPLAVETLPAELRGRARVIYQSLPRPNDAPDPDRDVFQVCVVAHLRSVKDPLLAARAARHVAEPSRLRVVHVGDVAEEAFRAELERERAENPRFEWRGPRSRCETLETLARSRLLLSTSRLEGGPNVVTEALALSRPVLATDIPGHCGLLGEHYPGLFPVGDERELGRLLQRAERDPAFYAELRTCCRERSWIADPGYERTAWRKLLAELLPGSVPA